MPCSMTPHRIGWAIKQARANAKVTRRGWRTPGQYITYVPTKGKAKQFLLWNTASGRSWPATLSQRDILAEDWMLVG